MQVLLVEEELHGFVWPLVDGGRGVVVLGAPVRSADRRLGYVEGVLRPGSRGGRGVIQIEQAPGLFAGVVGRGGGGRRRRRRRHGLVEVGLEQADRTLLGGLHRTGSRHLDGRRIPKVRGRASARRRRRRRRARRRSRAQRPDAGWLWRQGRLAGYWRPPVRADVGGASLHIPCGPPADVRFRLYVRCDILLLLSLLFRRMQRNDDIIRLLFRLFVVHLAAIHLDVRVTLFLHLGPRHFRSTTEP